ncbi:hypothetical protein [Deinococcus sp. QL22]|uniref:hypothetical protein n=1 Tax=Deinococcus sp. QL22 TaxID=2939437 RepID=UPI0020181109|nr:hypothetical protein [Deinococcus sp. QL22]UQN05473.1 hypothetical protein M1R55_11365 [Deinococcus sp. QL22]
MTEKKKAGASKSAREVSPKSAGKGRASTQEGARSPAPASGSAGNPKPTSKSRETPHNKGTGKSVRLGEGKTQVKPTAAGDPTEGGHYCGAKLQKTGKPCHQKAGARTDHPGEGRCWLHGGLTPIRSGRYSGITTRPRLQELIARFEADPDPLNLLPEVALVRAVALDFVERYDEMHEGLMRWNMSFDKAFRSDWGKWVREMRTHVQDGGDPDDEAAPRMPDPLSYAPTRPVQIIEISLAAGIASQVGALVDRINKMREDKTFSLSTIRRLQTAMGEDLEAATRRWMPDDDQRDRFLDEVEKLWNGIRLAGLTGPRARGSEEETQ